MPLQDPNNTWPPAPISDAGRHKSEKLRQRVAPSFWSAVAANILAILALMPTFFQKGEIFDEMGIGNAFLAAVIGGSFILINVPFSIYYVLTGSFRQKVTGFCGLLLSFTPLPLFGFLHHVLYKRIGFIF